jgi:AcrR family transcriptional regulator
MSREHIVDTARRMVEASGVETVSMRKLAAELGVAPTAIYWHVGGRDELLSAVFEQMLTDLPPIRVRGRTPAERIASIARAMRAQVQATPTLQRLALHLGRAPQASFSGHLALGRELTAAGLDGPQAADALRAVLYLMGGFVLLESSLRDRPPSAQRSEDLWRAVDDPQIAPPLVAAMSRPADPDAAFEYALRALLASILPR